MFYNDVTEDSTGMANRRDGKHTEFVGKHGGWIIRFVTPVVFNKLTRVQHMYLSNTILFDGRGIYIVFSA